MCFLFSTVKLEILSGDEFEIDLVSLTINQTPLFIMGDMNGRVGELSEFIKSDKNVNNHKTRSISETHRRNRDKQVNKIGEEITHLCKSFDRQIANDRLNGDLGNFTP